jgi:hypothetical protein
MLWRCSTTRKGKLVNVDRPFLLKARQITCAWVPVGCLLFLSAMGDFHAGARLAGALSLVFSVLTAFMLADSKPPRVHMVLSMAEPKLSRVHMVPGLLAWGSPAIPLLMLGYGRHWTEAAAVGLTVFLTSYVVILRRDMLAAVSMALSLVAGWVFALVGISDNWRNAAIWGGCVAASAALTFAVGRYAQGYPRDALAATVWFGPLAGSIVWGVSGDLGLAILLGLFPSVAAAAILILTKNHTDD